MEAEFPLPGFFSWYVFVALALSTLVQRQWLTLMKGHYIFQLQMKQAAFYPSPAGFPTLRKWPRRLQTQHRRRITAPIFLHIIAAST